jgi:hypothetical protein
VADTATEASAGDHPAAFVLDGGRDGAKVTVTPEEFKLIKYDSAEIAMVVASLAERLGVANPIHVIVDETTPLALMSAELDGTSSDATITIRAESGALEDTKHFTHFNVNHTEISIGRMLLRAHDRLRPDFADAPPDQALTLQQEAAWNTYVNGRLSRLGVDTNKQRWRYNHRNRFGFSDVVDADFEALWSADDLGWSDVTAACTD